MQQKTNPLTAQQVIAKWWEEEDVYSLCQILFKTKLTPMQEEIVKTVAFGKYKRIVICCMTRYGKSFSVSMGILLWILRSKDKRIVIVAPTNEKTTIIRNYMAFFISKSPELLELLDLDKTGYERIRKEVSKKRMTWKNGVEMRTLSAENKGAALMGFGADLVLIDEICDIEFETYRSKITRMLGDSPDSVCIGIGNPWTVTNQMWEQWKSPDWHKIHIGYDIALKEGRITPQFLEEQKSQLTEREFKVLYAAEFCEDDVDSLIHWSWIQRAIK